MATALGVFSNPSVLILPMQSNCLLEILSDFIERGAFGHDWDV